jgi:hypothetical protein
VKREEEKSDKRGEKIRRVRREKERKKK